MGAFGTQLEVALKEMKMRQVEVARRTGIVSQTMVNRYVNGAALPELASLEALAKIFPEHIRERLVTAYLAEPIPQSARHLVAIHPVSNTNANFQPVYGKAIHGSELAECLTYLEERAMNSPTVRDAVIATVRAMRGDPMNKPHDADLEENADLVTRENSTSRSGELRDLPIFGTIPAGGPSEGQALKPKRTVKAPKGKYPSNAFGLD